MEDCLINFETAKLAKEKGFSLTTKYFTYVYDNQDKSLCNIKTIDYYTELKEFSTIAPTQSLLQRWLREVHNIDVFNDCIASRKYYAVIYDNNITIGDDKVFELESPTSYEESLEIGLEEGLKLIK